MQDKTTGSMIACHDCDGLFPFEAIRPGQCARCPRCGAVLYQPKNDTVERSLALFLTGLILYIPANVSPIFILNSVHLPMSIWALGFTPSNVYPIMTVTILGKGEPDTIGSGVVALLDGGMWPLALIVFIASIFVPLLKMLGLTVLLLSVKYKWRWRPVQRTVMYRIIEMIGRWSMVDVFMISILVAVVAFGNLAEVYAGLGARAFALVVVFTIFAAKSFDPRLIWDSLKNDRKED